MEGEAFRLKMILKNLILKNLILKIWLLKKCNVWGGAFNYQLTKFKEDVLT